MKKIVFLKCVDTEEVRKVDLEVFFYFIILGQVFLILGKIRRLWMIGSMEG